MTKDLDRKIYVGGLSADDSENELLDLFAEFGRVDTTWVARHPPGFGFVEMESRSDAVRACDLLNGTRFKGRRLVVEMSTGDCRWDKWNIPRPGDPGFKYSERYIEPYESDRSSRRRRYYSRSSTCSRSRSRSRTIKSRSKSRSRRSDRRSRSRSTSVETPSPYRRTTRRRLSTSPSELSARTVSFSSTSSHTDIESRGQGQCDCLCHKAEKKTVGTQTCKDIDTNHKDNEKKKTTTEFVGEIPLPSPDNDKHNTETFSSDQSNQEDSLDGEIIVEEDTRNVIASNGVSNPTEMKTFSRDSDANIDGTSLDDMDLSDGEEIWDKEDSLISTDHLPDRNKISFVIKSGHTASRQSGNIDDMTKSANKLRNAYPIFEDGDSVQKPADDEIDMEIDSDVEENCKSDDKIDPCVIETQPNEFVPKETDLQKEMCENENWYKTNDELKAVEDSTTIKTDVWKGIDFHCETQQCKDTRQLDDTRDTIEDSTKSKDVKPCKESGSQEDFSVEDSDPIDEVTEVLRVSEAVPDDEFLNADVTGKVEGNKDEKAAENDKRSGRGIYSKGKESCCGKNNADERHSKDKLKVDDRRSKERRAGRRHSSSISTSRHRPERRSKSHQGRHNSDVRKKYKEKVERYEKEKSNRKCTEERREQRKSRHGRETETKRGQGNRTHSNRDEDQKRRSSKSEGTKDRDSQNGHRDSKSRVKREDLRKEKRRDEKDRSRREERRRSPPPAEGHRSKHKRT